MVLSDLDKVNSHLFTFFFFSGGLSFVSVTVGNTASTVIAWGSNQLTVFSQDGFVMVHFSCQLRTVHFTGLLLVAAIYLVSHDVARLCEAKFNRMLLLLPLLLRLGLRWHHLVLQQRSWLIFSEEGKGWTFFTLFCGLAS